MESNNLTSVSDPLLDEAKAVALIRGSVSVTHIQRAMHIGYTRAARLVDLMIQDGFCEPEYAEGEGYRRLKNIEIKNQ